MLVTALMLPTPACPKSDEIYTVTGPVTSPANTMQCRGHSRTQAWHRRATAATAPRYSSTRSSHSLLQCPGHDSSARSSTNMASSTTRSSTRMARSSRDPQQCRPQQCPSWPGVVALRDNIVAAHSNTCSAPAKACSTSSSTRAIAIISIWRAAPTAAPRAV